MGKPHIVGFDDLIEVIADQHHVSPDALVSEGRTKTVVRARAALCYALSARYELSLGEIGQLVGGRDHTTIRYLIRVHAERLGQNAPEPFAPGELARCSEGSNRAKVAYHSPWLT